MAAVPSAVVMDPAAFSFRLRHAREERGMSQAALASGICSASAVSRWESGQCVPTGEIIMQLANRLGLPTEILTRRELDSRFLTSSDGFGDLLDAAFDTGHRVIEESPMASWISRVRMAFRNADPWLNGSDPRPVVDDLAVDPFTVSTPVSLETVELLDAMVRVKETQERSAVDALIETLTWTVDAPQMIRRAVVETIVAILVNARMPIAAYGTVIRTDVPEITATTEALLKLSGASVDGLPPVAVDRSARDVAIGILSQLDTMPKQDRQRVATAVVAACPNDGLVELWARDRGNSNSTIGTTYRTDK